MEKSRWSLRTEVRQTDPFAIRAIVESSGFFRDDEVEVAVSLAEEHLEKGDASGYFFVFADRNDRTEGYACFGPIPCTQSSYDLYWIAVDETTRGGGLGRLLLEESERTIRQMAGTRVYIETSSKPLYEPTRQFYLRCGYSQVALLDDFYGPADSKVIYAKTL